MKIVTIQVQNFKSFADSGVVRLGPGFNVLVGKNNSGKTTLLEAMSLRFDHRPHRSHATAPSPLDHPKGASRVIVGFDADKDEIEALLLRRGIRQLSIPYPTGTQGNASALEAAFALVREAGPLLLEFETPDNAWLNRGFGLYQAGDFNGCLTFSDGKWKADGGSGGQALSDLVFATLQGVIYRFAAERMNVGSSSFGSNSALESNARNLPEVLGVLQHNHVKFERYNSLVRRVFSHIERISVQPQGTGELRIMVWCDPKNPDRADLAVPLGESGTGVGQVLAMLYVVATALRPQIFLIDEPGSFLHPSATRSLIEILREHPQHQYVISTHSPDVVVAARPYSVHLLRLQEGKSTIDSIDAAKAEDSRVVLREVGSRLSDVFGADSVVWVEGATEEVCFPMIAKACLEGTSSATVFVGVLSTGEFERQNPKETFRLYERLSSGPALIPPALGFVFDREQRSETKCEDLKRMGKGRVWFLPRRTYENFLFNGQCIAEVLNRHLPAANERISATQVNEWIEKRFVAESRAGSGADIAQIDGARTLEDLFFELSGGNVAYRKTRHSGELTELILAKGNGELDEVKAVIRQVLSG